MPTRRQALGDFGEVTVVKTCVCPKCKRPRTLKQLPTNFKCADVVCDFCGYLAQVKATQQPDIKRVPDKILGGAWGVQKERMDAGIYFPLFIVVVHKADPRRYAIYYLAADLQPPEMFKQRKPLSGTAKRAGWQGFTFDMQLVKERVVRLT